jgi:hypothetical protein
MVVEEEMRSVHLARPHVVARARTRLNSSNAYSNLIYRQFRSNFLHSTATFNCPEYKDFVGCIVRGAFSSGPKKPYELSFGLPVMCFEPPKIDYDQDRSIFMSKLTDCMVKVFTLIHVVILNLMLTGRNFNCYGRSFREKRKGDH